MCLCNCNKKCKIGQHLNNCDCIKSVFDNLVITCEIKIVNTSTNSLDKKVTYKINCYFFTVFFCMQQKYNNIK